MRNMLKGNLCHSAANALRPKKQQVMLRHYNSLYIFIYIFSWQLQSHAAVKASLDSFPDPGTWDSPHDGPFIHHTQTLLSFPQISMSGYILQVKNKQHLPNICPISVMPESGRSSMPLEKWYTLGEFCICQRFRFDSTFCQPLKKTDTSCTMFRFIYFSTGIEVRVGKRTWRENFSSFPFSFFFCCDNKLSNFEQLQGVPPLPSTRGRRTRLTLGC